VTLDALVLADTHIRSGRARRLPDAAVVIYGHSHQPDESIGVDGQRLFNPGSPTERRRAPNHTYGLLTFDKARVRAHRIVSCDS
jgi:predicted phosphodiesterase